MGSLGIIGEEKKLCSFKGKKYLDQVFNAYSQGRKKNCSIKKNKIRKIFSAPNHDKTYTITAELLKSNYDMIGTIIFPSDFPVEQKVEFEYDKYSQNIEKKKTIYKDREITDLYNYE